MGAPLIWKGNSAKLLKSSLEIPGATSGALTLSVPNAVTSYSLVLPAAQGGVNQMIRNDGSGNLSWVNDPTLQYVKDGTNSSVLMGNVAANIASGQYSTAEGSSTTSSGSNSHAEGSASVASGPQAHAEGGSTLASGNNSHAEGVSTTASGNNSHAGGESSVASGLDAFAHGESLIAQSRSQAVFGQFNVAQGNSSSWISTDDLLILGNGANSGSRSNAFSVSKDGTVKLYGTTSGILSVKAAAATTSHSLTMPAAQGGAGTVLTNDGSGNLSWATAGIPATTTFTLANNQSSPANVTGFTVSSGTNKSFWADINIRRFFSAVSDGAPTNRVMSNVASTAFGAGATIWSVAVQPDGKLIVLGDFAGFNGNGCRGIVRLNADGTEDLAFTANCGTGFNTTPGGLPKVKLLSTGAIIVACSGPASFDGTSYGGILKLSSAGVFDTTFNTNIGTGFVDSLYGLMITAADDIIVLGRQTTFNGSAAADGITKLSSAGVFDSTFDTNLGTGVDISGGQSPRAAAEQSDNKIVVVGDFTTFNGNGRNKAFRLNSDGTEDTAYYTALGTAFSGIVQDCVIQADDSVVMAGAFSAFNGNTRYRMVRIDSTGTEDAAFYGNLGSSVDGVGETINAVALQSDGKIVAVGDFTVFNANGRVCIFRLNSSGTEDTAFYTALGSGFNNGGTADLKAVAVSAEDLILTGGDGFTSIDGVARQDFAFLGTPATNVAFQGVLRGAYQDVLGAWDVGGVTGMSEEPHGIDFSMTAGGQLQYTSSNILGTSVTNELKYRLNVM